MNLHRMTISARYRGGREESATVDLPYPVATVTERERAACDACREAVRRWHDARMWTAEPAT